MSPAPRPYFSVAGLRHGARAALPAFPGFIMFAIAFGTAAAQKGLSLGETLGLSAFVYAGASQMVGLEIWQQVCSPATILTIVTVTAVTAMIPRMVAGDHTACQTSSPTICEAPA